MDGRCTQVWMYIISKSGKIGLNLNYINKSYCSIFFFNIHQNNYTMFYAKRAIIPHYALLPFLLRPFEIEKKFPLPWHIWAPSLLIVREKTSHFFLQLINEYCFVFPVLQHGYSDGIIKETETTKSRIIFALIDLANPVVPKLFWFADHL